MKQIYSFDGIKCKTSKKNMNIQGNDEIAYFNFY